MKISLVTETFPPEINGVAMTLDRLAGGLVRRGVQLSVVVPERKDRDPTAVFGYHLLQVPGLPLPRYPELRFGLPAFQSLSRYWGRFRPDVVHVATEGPLGWSAIQAARFLEIPLVSSFHTNFHSYGSHYGFGFLQHGILCWLRHFHRQCLKTYVPSEDVRQRLREAGFRNVAILSRGIDAELFGPHRRDPDLRRSWGVSATTPVVMYVGRLAPEKNLALLLQAYSRMRQILPDLKLVLLGDGPAMDSIRQTCPDVHFAGMRKGSDLAAHYASADGFLFASLTETFGNVVTEAMASSLPVLAFEYAAPARFIRNGHNGFLAPFGNEVAFLEQASMMAAARDTWETMGQRARQTLLPHSWDSVVDGYLRDLKRLPPLTTRQSA